MWGGGQLESLVNVALFAYLGVLCRAGLSHLGTQPNLECSVLVSLGPSFFLPNIIGSFLMGLLAPLGTVFQPYANLYTGVTSGFCGSCTTFATWQVIASVTAMHNFLDSVLISLVTLSTSYSSLLFGYHIGEAIERLVNKNQIFKQENDTNFQHLSNEDSTPSMGLADANVSSSGSVASAPTDDNSCILLSLLAPVTLVCLSLLIWTCTFLDKGASRNFWVAACFAPFGAVTRYMLSLGNTKYPSFPIFTLLANYIGTVCNIGMLILVNHIWNTGAPATLSTTLHFWITNGLVAGGMGSLSTVSTWVKEIKNLKLGNAYVYSTASIFLSQISCIFMALIYQNVSGYELKLKLDI